MKRKSNIYNFYKQNYVMLYMEVTGIEPVAPSLRRTTYD